MTQGKYIGMDFHQATISVGVMNSSGKLMIGSSSPRRLLYQPRPFTQAN